MKRKNMFNKMIMLLFGSWTSVIWHTILFYLIIIYFKDLLFFNTLVSIEAIYIGIFILMAEYRQESEREKRESAKRYRDRSLVKEDVSITQNVMDEIKTLKKHQRSSAKALAEIKELLANQTTSTTP